MLALAGCLSDRPVAPMGSGSALALRVMAKDSVQQQAVEVRVYYYPYGAGRSNPRVLPEVSSVDLYDASFNTTSGSRRTTATFPVTGCIRYFPPDELGAYCSVYVELTLRSGTEVLDQQTLYGLIVRPGQITDAGTVDFGSSNNPPVVTEVTRGVRVYGNLVRYGFTGSDANGDIDGALASVFDSSGVLVGQTAQFFPQLVASVNASTPPGLYAYVPTAATAMSYTAHLTDAQGNASEPEAGDGIDRPSSGAFVYEVTSTLTADSIFLTARWSAGQAPLTSMDFVVQNFAGASVVDTIFTVCSAAIVTQNGQTGVVCARPPGLGNGHVTASPADALGQWGQGYDCDLGDLCNNSIVVPDRRRHH